MWRWRQADPAPGAAQRQPPAGPAVAEAGASAPAAGLLALASARGARRGSFRAATAALATEEARRDAVGDLLRDSRAASARGPHESRIRTWAKLAEEAGLQLLPLTRTSIITVMGALKKAGYRSAPAYLAAIRDRHISEKHAWSDDLALAAKAAARSAIRGIGPARQSAPIPIAAALSAIASDEPLARGGPVAVPALLVLGSVFCLRGIEVLAARLGDLQLDFEAQVVRIVFGPTKTDVRGKGVMREWGCLCVGSEGSDNFVCPFHAAGHLVDVVHARFGSDANLPLFPTASGDTPTKEALYCTLEAAAEAAGETVRDSEGARFLGEHSLRVSGARWLAARGLSRRKIKACGRWRSRVVDRYVGDARLARLTGKVRRRLAHTPDRPVAGMASAPGMVSSACAPRPPLRALAAIRAGPPPIPCQFLAVVGPGGLGGCPGGGRPLAAGISTRASEKSVDGRAGREAGKDEGRLLW